MNWFVKYVLSTEAQLVMVPHKLNIKTFQPFKLCLSHVFMYDVFWLQAGQQTSGISKTFNCQIMHCQDNTIISGSNEFVTQYTTFILIGLWHFQLMDGWLVKMWFYLINAFVGVRTHVRILIHMNHVRTWGG